MLAGGDGGGRGCRHRLTSDAFAEPAGAAVLSASRGARQLMEDADAHAGRYEQGVTVDRSKSVGEGAGLSVGGYLTNSYQSRGCQLSTRQRSRA